MSERGNASQTIVNGTVGGPPWVFTSLLLVVVFLLGWTIAKLGSVGDDMKRVERDMLLIREDLHSLQLPKSLPGAT